VSSATPLTPRIWALHAAAAAGKGLHGMAPQASGSDDWRTVLTVFHEAGHAAVARAHGFAASIEVFNTENGVCNTPMDHADAHLVALAGSIAASFAMLGLSVPTEDLANDLNAVDRSLAGAFTSADVSAAADIVWKHWAEISDEASQIMSELEEKWRYTPPAAAGTSWIRAEALHWHRQQQAQTVRPAARARRAQTMEAPDWYRAGERLVFASLRRQRQQRTGRK